MAVSYQDYLNVRVSPAVYGLTLAALRAGGAPDDSALSETDKTRAFLAVFNTIQGLTKERPETVQADTERLWGTLSGRHKHEIAANPGAATSIVAEAMRGDAALALKLPDILRNAGPGQGPAEPGSFFARDAFGRIGWDRATAGDGYSSRSYALSLAAYSADVSRITAGNWGDSNSMAFINAGLDYRTFSYLRGLGFSPTQMIHAGQDARALGLNSRDPKTAESLATLDRADPEGRAARVAAWQRYDRWLKENKDEIERRKAAIEAVTDPAERERLRREYEDFLKRGKDATGVSAIADRPGIKNDPKAGGAVDDITGKIEQINGAHLQMIQDMKDRPAARAVDDTVVTATSEPGGAVKRSQEVAADTLTAEADAAATADAFGIDVAEAPPAEAQPVRTATAEQPEKKKENAKPVETAAADPPPARPVQVATAKPPAMTA
jgi:hypothetical protein